MEQNDLQRAIMAVLFAAGEPVAVERLCQSLGVDEGELTREVRALMDALAYNRSGIRIIQLENAYQMCSASEQAEIVTRTLETRKPPKLSQSQLETLTVIAYYQPATRAYVEQIRGVDSAYCVSALLAKKLICEDGRLNVPGRPIVYRTTPDFLRVFGLRSLDELPEIEKIEFQTRQQLQMQLEREKNSEQPQEQPAPEPAQSAPEQLRLGEEDAQ